MNRYEKLNSVLKSEADLILHDYGLWETLKAHGEPIIQGSYLLNLMTWRDLDIHLENNEITIKDFFNMGVEIATKLKPYRMSFRNEFIGKTPDLPEGLYWGVYTKLVSSEEWKIDIWAMDSDQTKADAKKTEALKSKLNEKNRLTILKLKSHLCKHPEHRKSFSSTDIYRSVIEENVTSIRGFSDWLRRTKGISI